MTDSITAINILRDSLRTNLTDPYVSAGGQDRGGSMWIFSDEPVSTYKFPQIQLKKLDNPTEIISMGYDSMEYEQLFVDIWFKCKNGFKIVVNGTTYSNAQLVEYYQGLIKSTLKAQGSTLHTAGAQGFKNINSSEIAYDSDTQLYFGKVTVRVFYFNGGC